MIAALRRRFAPVAPPVETRERIPGLVRVHPDESFISGNGIAARCRYVVNFDALKVNEDVDNDWWFCQTEFLEHFFRRVAPKRDFVLFSHNSDREIGKREHRFVRNRHLRAWFSTNIVLRDPKLFALPLGIANPRWRHGDSKELARVQAAAPPKTKLFHASYDVGTNLEARLYCAQQTRLTPGPPQPFADYLQDLASSYFCIAPRGNGLDTHRAWEALYLRTIPVVIRSVVSEQHEGFPFVVLDDWSQFRELEFSPELYDRVWGDWDPAELRLDRYVERIERLLASRRV